MSQRDLTGTPREGANATVAGRRPRVRVRQRQNPVYKQRVETNKHTAVLTDTVASPKLWWLTKSLAEARPLHKQGLARKCVP